MNILILGSGGREHALAWAVKQNPKCDRLIVAPGNAGIAAVAECATLDILDGGAVAVFCEENAIDFVIVGPEAPLAAGVADRLRAAGILTFGPSAAAARLEASKAFTKDICDACGAPTAAWARFTAPAPACDYVKAKGAPIVVKADGLAAGKGVVVAMTVPEALAAIDDMFGGALGNAGIAQGCETADIDILDGAAVVAFAAENAIDFVIVGPEAPLAAGVADACRAAGLLTFGPSAAAARLEASKAFTKDICDACQAPTAAWARFDQPAPARAHVQARGAPIVIKADGLAAGKGVVVAMTQDEALAAIDDMFGGALGNAGAEVVIEEFMAGEEASFFVLTDGTDVLPIGTAQDHKRAFDGDTGPNTGGMGAYSPAPVLTEAIQQQVLERIVRPTVAEMARRGTPYQGVLYAGLMIENGVARLVEYNARFGDPECQVMMLRMGAQVLDLMLACAEERLAGYRVNWANDHALTVVMAAKGYPGSYAKGSVIGGLGTLPEDSSHMLFHAGTTDRDGLIVASGGRVLNVTARGDTLAQARERAYAMVDAIDWPEGFCRRDIGWRAL